VGDEVGEVVGDEVGEVVGEVVGACVGDGVGAGVGDGVGAGVGDGVGAGVDGLAMPVVQPEEAQAPAASHAGKVPVAYAHDPSVSGEQPSADARA